MRRQKEQQKTSVRIKRIRKEAGLRQWELARALGTTQSAIHKYEHGVTPESRRLLKLARIGHTTVEWILTGRHWENGYTGKERIPSDILELAYALKSVSDEKRKTYMEAIELLEESMKVLERKLKGKLGDHEVEAIAHALKGLAPDVLEVLSAASSIQNAIQNKIVSWQKTRFLNAKSQKDH